ncbi:MAG: hypothetical protein C4335_14475 [Armatimonadota bacterium]
MSRSIVTFGVGVALLVVGIVLWQTSRRPAPYQREKQQSVIRAVRLWGVLSEETPMSAQVEIKRVNSRGFPYAVCVVDLFGEGGHYLATCPVDMFTGELIYIACAMGEPTGAFLTEAQAHRATSRYARDLGLMTPECPWKLVEKETIGQKACFCWAAGRYLLGVRVDRSNSRLLYASTRALSTTGYCPH